MNFYKGLSALRLCDQQRGLLRLRSVISTINSTDVGNNGTFKKSQFRSITNNPSNVSAENEVTPNTPSNVSAENEVTPNTPTLVDKELSRRRKISKAMQAYIHRSVEQEKFMVEKITEYEIGKRHLANMMGADPETFTQDDINNAINYLLPSGLFETLARPVMKHPHDLFPRKKEAEFDEMGRPFKSLFYTGKPNFYSILQQMSIKAKEMDNQLQKMKIKPTDKKMSGEESKFVNLKTLEKIILENLTEELYDYFTRSLERLMDHPLSSIEEEFIMKYREQKGIITFALDIPEFMYKENGVPYVNASGKRKTCTADVTVYGQGTGKVTVNGDDILYFESHQDREQVMFPLQFTGLLRSVDVEATVRGGGSSGQAGALRYALSLALRSFTTPAMVERMRIGGLLTLDARKKERQKPGRWRARRKFTWKKR